MLMTSIIISLVHYTKSAPILQTNVASFSPLGLNLQNITNGLNSPIILLIYPRNQSEAEIQNSTFDNNFTQILSGISGGDLSKITQNLSPQEYSTVTVQSGTGVLTASNPLEGSGSNQRISLDLSPAVGQELAPVIGQELATVTSDNTINHQSDNTNQFPRQENNNEISTPSLSPEETRNTKLDSQPINEVVTPDYDSTEGATLSSTEFQTNLRFEGLPVNRDRSDSISQVPTSKIPLEKNLTPPKSTGASSRNADDSQATITSYSLLPNVLQGWNLQYVLSILR